jgi:hypothetical protein
MHLCHAHPGRMEQLEPGVMVPGEAGINEEHVADSGPYVRALVVQRLEQVWRACEPHINPDQEAVELGFRRDPRYIEAGIRVLDRLTAIYGLLKPHATQADPDAGSSVEVRAALVKDLEELEVKIHGGS